MDNFMIFLDGYLIYGTIFCFDHGNLWITNNHDICKLLRTRCVVLTETRCVSTTEIVSTHT